ncbi:flagellar hook-length control protein FliK [Arsenicitalea aurantiaca]|nr:flagellar hook-length control protein FliK [Arsenicitalea aurantiaca]
MLGAFAALLGAIGGDGARPAIDATSSLLTSPAALAPGGEDGEPSLLDQLASLLGELEAARPDDQPPSSELVDRLDDLLDGLAALFPPTAELPPLPEDGPLAAFAQRAGELVAPLGAEGEALAARLRALAAALAAAPSAEALAASGGTKGLEAALQALLGKPVDVSPAAQTRPLGEARLETPDMALHAPSPQQVRTRTEPSAPIRPAASEPNGAQGRTEASPAGLAASAGLVETTPGELDADGQPLTPLQGRPELGAGAKLVQSAYNAPASQVNVPQLAYEIVRQVQAGNSRFQIRLDPPELGRIDVRLDMDGSGTVNARLTVERAETLDLLQRDQRALERALMQAGLDGTKTNLEFSLRQNPFSNAQGDGRDPDFYGNAGLDGTEPDRPETERAILYRGIARPGGLDLFV